MLSGISLQTYLVLISFFNVFGTKGRSKLMKLADKTKVESIILIEHDEDIEQQSGMTLRACISRNGAKFIMTK